MPKVGDSGSRKRNWVVVDALDTKGDVSLKMYASRKDAVRDSVLSVVERISLGDRHIIGSPSWKKYSSARYSFLSAAASGSFDEAFDVFTDLLRFGEKLQLWELYETETSKGRQEQLVRIADTLIREEQQKQYGA